MKYANGVPSTGGVVVKETPSFERSSRKILTNEERADLKLHLSLQPGAGRVIPGSGGLRKLRWAAGGEGTRGGARIIYVVVVRAERIYLLFAYLKRRQEDLTTEQVRDLSKIAKELKKQ
jgi:hypothetical protein